MKRRPIGYLVQQSGLGEYAEIVRTKKEAVQVARECLWWSKKVTVRPLYAGRPVAWVGRREIARRAGA